MQRTLIAYLVEIMPCNTLTFNSDESFGPDLQCEEIYHHGQLRAVTHSAMAHANHDMVEIP